MYERKSNRIALLVLVFSFLVAVYMFFHIVTSPGYVLVDMGGDAGKNYYTYLYHILYGNGMHNECMNYPFGEHIVYTDGQPLLAIPLNYLNKWMPVSINTALAIMHLVIFLSYVVAIIYTYKILTYQKVKPIWAVLFAALIIMLSPQYFRTKGHFGLSHACYIPMLLYWLAKYKDSSKWKYAMYIFLFNIIMSLMHPYNLATCLLIGGLYIAGYFFFTRDTFLNKARHSYPVFLAVIGALLFFKLLMSVTDNINDRPELPYGTLVYTSSLKQVLTSSFSPFWKIAEAHKLYENIAQEGEGYAYIGLIAMSVLFVSVVIFIGRRITKKRTDDVEASFIWLFIAGVSLLLAMGIPFIWNMEWLLNYMSLFRQFRTLGRISWIFYYIITIYAAVVLYRWYAAALLKRPVFGYTAMLLSLLVWGIEANAYVHEVWSDDSKGKGIYNRYMVEEMGGWDAFMRQHNYKFDNFQAVLYLPYVNYGTDKIGLNEDGGIWLLRHALCVSLKYKLPIINSMLARSSWSQAEEQVRLSGGIWSNKSILDKMGSNKPFLLLCLDENVIDPDQRYLLEASDSLGHYIQYNVYACYPDRIRANDNKNKAMIKPACDAMDYTDSCTTFKGDWFVYHFDDRNSKDHFFGPGSLPYSKADSALIETPALKPLYDGQIYEFSYWALLSSKDYRSPDFVLDMTDSFGAVIATERVRTFHSADNKGLWFRGGKYFKVPSNTRHVKCSIVNTSGPSYISLDEIMLRPADALIISKAKDGNIMVNNHPYKTINSDQHL